MSALVFGTAIASSGALDVDWRYLAGVIGLISYLLLARVFDEHKDFEFDVEHLSWRPLPRGAISWREVDGLGVFAFVVTLAMSLAVDGGIGHVTLWWAIATAYLVLTRYEFFIRPWLRAHFVTNTVTHLPVYCLAAVWVAQFGASPEPLPTAVLWLAAFAYVHTFGIDLWRKSKAPEDERPLVDSYTQRFGVPGAAALTAALVVASAAFAAVMLHAADADSAVGYAVLAVMPLPLLVALARFVKAPGPATNKQERDILAATLVGLQVTMIVVIAVHHGLR